MALRVRLSASDLARIVIQPALGPFGEALLSFDMIRTGSRFGGLQPWPRNIRASVSPLARHAAALFTLSGPPLDLWTAMPFHDDLDSALDEFLGLPDRVLKHEIEAAVGGRVMPRWTAPMVGTDLESRRLLARAISDMAGTFVTPYWTQMQSYLRTERSAAAHRFLLSGLDGMMSQLHPCITWDPPWLILGCGPVRPEVLVTWGQGLVLAPAVHIGPHPAVFQSSVHDDPLLVIYPAIKEYADVHRLWNRDRDPDALARLIGQSRADLLAAVRERPGLAVRDLATAVGISSAAASEHIAVLRKAGLVTGQRHGKALIHTLTVLGSSMLDGPTAGSPPWSRSAGTDSP